MAHGHRNDSKIGSAGVTLVEKLIKEKSTITEIDLREVTKARSNLSSSPPSFIWE